MFRTVIPLTPVAVEKVGPQEKTHDATHDRTHDATHDKTHDAILAFCVEPLSKAEIAEHCGYKNTKISLRNTYAHCLIAECLK